MTAAAIEAPGRDQPGSDRPGRDRPGRDRPRPRAAEDPLQLLHEVSREMIGILDRDELLRRVAELVKPLIDYQLFGVYLWNEAEQRLEQEVSVGLDGCQSVRTSLGLGEGLCGQAAALRRPVRVGDVTEDPEYIYCGDGDVRSELALPLMVKDRLLGALDLESYRPDAFSACDERLMMTLAGNLAVALENAALVEQVRDDERKMAAELETARQMQQVLLPRRTPWLPGLQTAVAYCPAHQLGGDLYDFLSYGEHRTAVVVGDVAGKGTGSALYAALAVGHLRGYVADNQCPPSCMLSYLNAELLQLHAERRFLALTFAVYDQSASTLTVASSGLPYPYLLRDGKAEEIVVSGVPLGMLADTDYQQVTVELVPGDVVVFTTDGIDECLGPGDEPFGDAGVRRALAGLETGSARDIADGLLAATDHHLAGEREPSDDRTVVVLKITGPRS